MAVGMTGCAAASHTNGVRVGEPAAKPATLASNDSAPAASLVPVDPCASREPCFRAGPGAWSFLPSVAPAPGKGPRGSLAFIGNDGTVAAIETNELHAARVFDYDGDGVGELLVTGAAGAGAGAWGSVWTMRKGTIVPYGTVANERIESFDDVDNDGRPDIIVERAAWVNGCGGTPQKAIGVRFALHSRQDGSFAAADDAAIAYAKRSCPRGVSGGSVHVKNGSIVPGESARRITCARLWGRSKQDVAKQVDRVCTKLVPDAETCGKKTYAPNECPAWLSRWAQADFPLQIVVTEP